MTIKYLSDYNPDGACLGRAATDKVGFYGTTPIVRPSVTAVTTGATTTALTTATVAIYDALLALGLIT